MSQAISFLGLPDHLAEGRPRAVIFGAGHGSAYPGRDSLSAAAAAAIRAHVLETWRALVADGASDSSWQPAVLRLLAELDRA